MGKAQLEELEKRGMYLSVPSGRSMWPMLRSRQDIVEIRRLERPAKRYDVVLYLRGEDRDGVLHRVLHVREQDYVIAGDNCWWKEYIPKERVAGIATRFYRKGRWYEMDHRGYRLYVHLWTDLFFLRSPLLYVREKARALLGRLKRALLKQKSRNRAPRE